MAITPLMPAPPQRPMDANENCRHPIKLISSFLRYMEIVPKAALSVLRP
jgi:hypothetical protein